jgi:hypothetical protein
LAGTFHVYNSPVLAKDKKIIHIRFNFHVYYQQRKTNDEWRTQNNLSAKSRSVAGWLFPFTAPQLTTPPGTRHEGHIAKVVWSTMTDGTVDRPSLPLLHFSARFFGLTAGGRIADHRLRPWIRHNCFWHYLLRGVKGGLVCDDSTNKMHK